MKYLSLPLFSLFMLFFACKKSDSIDASKTFPNGPDEDSVRTLSYDTLRGVINLPFNSLYDMDFYTFQGPATITIDHFDKVQWPCALLLKEYPASGGTIPLQESTTNSIVIATAGKAVVSVQKADEACGGIVPYKIVAK